MNAPTTLQSRVADYLAERRRLGFELEDQGRTLTSFARYVDHLGSPGPLTLEIMAEWARRDRQHRDTPETWARRLLQLRPFTRYLRQFDPGTEIPDESIFGPVPRRRTPHIFEDQEIVDLLAAARGLGPRGDLRAATYETLFGLIAATGLRVSEAAHLLDTDVDLTQGLLTIRQTKFHKSRQLPVHSTTTEALRRYRQLRRQHLSDTPEAPFFVGTRGQRRGQPLGLRQIARVFERLRDQLRWINRGDHAAPRVHDLRHTFAVRRVLRWHEQGVDIDHAMLALSTYLGHVKISDTYWYLTGIPDLMAVAARKFEGFARDTGGCVMTGGPRLANAPPSFSALIQEFFTHYLVEQRALSPRTVAAYRDAFLLFLAFAQQRLGRLPAALSLADLTPELILAFLDHLECERHNTVQSRNLRLAALRAFFKFASRRDLASLQIIERALSIPMKRFESPRLGFLSREEMQAVIGEPGSTWFSQRDHLLLGLLYNTGARVSEIIGVKVGDVVLEGTPCVHLRGKGRKHRSVPLWKSSVQEIRTWLRSNPQLGADSALLPNREGQLMTRANVAQRLDLAVQAAAHHLPSLAGRHVSPHWIRHTTAMHLLQSGVDISVIALWLGHESPKTTYRYVEADLAMKDRALSRLQDPGTQPARFHASDSLLQFLRSL